MAQHSAPEGRTPSVDRLSGTALITGGTSGIGASFAEQLAARGHDLVLVARDTERLKKLATELEQRFAVSVEVLTADLSERDQVLRVAERLTDAERPIGLLVSNAGFGLHARLTDADTARIEYGMDVMCRAVLILGSAAGRTMRERGSGWIINVSSTAGFVTMGGYSAIKAWVTSYSEALSVELGGSGVGVTALCPGWVRTEFHERAGIRVSKIPAPLWLDVDRVVADCLDDVERGRVVSIPSRRYKILITLARMAPRSAVRAVSRKLSSSRRSA